VGGGEGEGQGGGGEEVAHAWGSLRRADGKYGGVRRMFRRCGEL